VRLSLRAGALRIACCNVSLRGFGDADGTPQRLSLLDQIVEAAKKGGAALVCLPGGYLREPTQSTARIVSDLSVAAAGWGISVALGIDCAPKDLAADWTDDVTRQLLPWFAFCWSASAKSIDVWRQRSVTRQDQWDAPEAACQEHRTLSVEGKGVEILMCGEFFNSRIRRSVAGREGEVVACVDLCHKGKGFRAWCGLQHFSEHGLDTFCVFHADTPGSCKYAYRAGGSNVSVRATDVVIAGPPRVEMKFWDVPLRSAHGADSGG